MSQKTIPHSEMISRLAKRFDLAEVEVKALIETLMEEVAIGATNHGGTMFRGFGRFLSVMNEKAVFNPKTREHVGQRTYVSMYFKPFDKAIIIDA